MTDDLPIPRFSMHEVDQAPERPGLYAWYAAFVASPRDWEFQASPNGDLAINGFLGVIRKYAGYFEPMPIGLTGRSSYGARWDGSLMIDFPLRSGEPSAQDGTQQPDQELAALADALDTEERRKVMAMILRDAAPLFSSPLYVGVAENLRSRLQAHRREFTRAADWLREHPEDMERVRLGGKSFGPRAAARGIAMEHLEVWIMALDPDCDPSLTTKHLRNTAEAAEWLLHRLYSPTLGRQ